MTGQDIIELLKDGYAIYTTAKDWQDKRKAEDKVAAKDITAFKDFVAKFDNALQNLPSAMSVKERTDMVNSTLALVDERLKNQDPQDDDIEIVKLQTQRFILSVQALKLTALAIFNPAAMVEPGSLTKLLADLQVAEAQVAEKMKVAEYTAIAVKVAIFAIQLGVLIAKAAG